MIHEIGYVIIHNTKDGYEYYRGCARGRDTKWSKTLVASQVYRSEKLALNTLNTITFRDIIRECEIRKVRMTLVD